MTDKHSPEQHERPCEASEGDDARRQKKKGPLKGLLNRIRGRVHSIAMQHQSPSQLGVAVGLGAVIGSTPFYGLHALIGLPLGALFRLNQLALFAGQQVSLPLFAPFLAFASVQLGHRLLYQSAPPISRAIFERKLTFDLVRPFFTSWLVGGLIVGASLGVALGMLTFFSVRAIRRRSSAAAANPEETN